MTGSVFFETMRRSWRGTLLWGFGIAVMGVYCILIIPDSKVLQQYGEIMKTMPSWVMAMVGGGDAAFLATPNGFLSYVWFGWMVLVLAVWGVIVGLGVTANEEDRGIMDVLLSTPLKRSRLVIEKVAAFVVLLLVIIFIGTLGLAIPAMASELFKDSMGRMIESTFNMIPSCLVILMFTVFIGTLVRRRNTAAAIAATFVGGSYFIDVIGRSTQATNALRVVSFYSYYDSTGVMQNGLAWGNIALLVGISIALFLGSLYLFERRDIGI